jgi:hypothetical protein
MKASLPHRLLIFFTEMGRLWQSTVMSFAFRAFPTPCLTGQTGSNVCSLLDSAFVWVKLVELSTSKLCIFRKYSPRCSVLIICKCPRVLITCFFLVANSEVLALFFLWKNVYVHWLLVFSFSAVLLKGHWWGWRNCHYAIYVCVHYTFEKWHYVHGVFQFAAKSCKV